MGMTCSSYSASATAPVFRTPPGGNPGRSRRVTEAVKVAHSSLTGNRGGGRMPRARLRRDRRILIVAGGIVGALGLVLGAVAAASTRHETIHAAPGSPAASAPGTPPETPSSAAPAPDPTRSAAKPPAPSLPDDESPAPPPGSRTPSPPPPPPPPVTAGTGKLVRWTASGGRTVALTFDDGPSPDWTPQVLALLRQYHITATFCLIGNNVKR